MLSPPLRVPVQVSQNSFCFGICAWTFASGRSGARSAIDWCLARVCGAVQERVGFDPREVPSTHEGLWWGTLAVLSGLPSPGVEYQRPKVLERLGHGPREIYCMFNSEWLEGSRPRALNTHKGL